MTFTEAAAQVLRLVGKPLHYKEITDVAIEKNLLSHVGKSPEVTMGARLAALVKKGDKENPLVRIKPGVFALRDWDKATIDKGLADRTPALEIAKHAKLDLSPITPVKRADDDDDDEVLVSADAGDEDDEDDAPPVKTDAEEMAREQRAAGATELFEAEDDDDLPILGRPDDAEGEEDIEGEGAADANGRRRRRRRRRGGRGTERDEPRSSGDDLPTYTVSDAPADVQVDGDAEPGPDRERDRGGAPERDRDRDRGRDRGRGRDDRERRDDRDRDRDRDRRDDPGGPIDELAAKPLADAVAALLGTFDRGGGPVGVQKVADLAQRRGRLTGDFQAAQGLILAAARADNLRRSANGARPRFRISGGRLALTEWAIDAEALRLERDVLAQADRYREAVRRSLLRKMQDLPPRAIGELVCLLLERVGMTDIQMVRRPGSPGTELHLSAVARGPSGNMPTAIVVRRDGREIGRERVTELRGALHHYGSAAAGWLVTTGQVLSGAREEASAVGAAPVALVDGIGFARLCEEHGVAVLETRVSLPIIDFELLEALRGS